MGPEPSSTSHHTKDALASIKKRLDISLTNISHDMTKLSPVATSNIPKLSVISPAVMMNPFVQRAEMVKQSLSFLALRQAAVGSSNQSAIDMSRFPSVSNILPVATNSSGHNKTSPVTASNAPRRNSNTSDLRNVIPFKCPLCSLVYRTQTFLNEHMRKEHSVLI